MINCNEPVTIINKDELFLVKQALQTQIEVLDELVEAERCKGVMFKVNLQRLIDKRYEYLKLIAQI